MKITVANFRGCVSAEIDTTHVALVGGQNEAGKSSLSQAVIAALTGQQIPVGAVAGGRIKTLVSKGDAWRLVTGGSSSASVTIATDNGSATVKWPECEYSTSGAAPTASLWAAGGASIVDLDPAGRVKVLTDLLDAKPRDVPAGVQVWLDDNAGDWDAAFAAATARGAEMKGEWRAVTGEQYGSAKAKSWTPDGYTGRALPLLAAELEAAQNAVDIAIAKGAVCAADMRRDKAIADRVDELRDVLVKVKASAAAADAKLNEARAAREAAPAVWGDSGWPCPWCEKHVRIAASGHDLERVEMPHDREEHDRRHKEIEAIDAALKTARADAEAATKLHDSIRADYDRAVEAAERLASASGTPIADSVDAARAALASAKIRHSAAIAYERANAIADGIAKNAERVALLAPTGLRQAALDEAIAGFNSLLADLCAHARWLPVRIAADMSIERDGMPYSLISASAQYRARVVIQLAIAAIQSSSMVVIDGFDILDKAGRNGLLRLINKMDIPALITATFSSRDVMPDLSKIGGRSYWIADGVADGTD